MGAKVTAAEAEAIFVKVGLEVLLGQAMISTQDERLGVANHDMQPMEQTRVGIVGLVLMGIALQSRDIAPVTITVNRTARGKRSLGKFFDRGPPDILRDPHLGIEGIPTLIQKHSRKNFRLFRAPAPFLSNSWTTKVGVVKLNGPIEPMGFVPLTHSGTDTHEHIPCGFIGRPQH